MVYHKDVFAKIRPSMATNDAQTSKELGGFPPTKAAKFIGTP